jgi:hypothetical protein
MDAKRGVRGVKSKTKTTMAPPPPPKRGSSQASSSLSSLSSTSLSSPSLSSSSSMSLPTSSSLRGSSKQHSSLSSVTPDLSGRCPHYYRIVFVIVVVATHSLTQHSSIILPSFQAYSVSTPTPVTMFSKVLSLLGAYAVDHLLTLLSMHFLPSFYRSLRCVAPRCRRE